MITDDLYQLCESENITVLCGAALPLTKSVSLNIDGEGFIGIDDSAMETDADERVHLAHEVGHCVNNAFYTASSLSYQRRRCEYIADRWAAEYLISPKRLKSLIVAAGGEVRAWELADEFGVTEDFLCRAVQILFPEAI